jgi:hypothetical protein
MYDFYAEVCCCLMTTTTTTLDVEATQQGAFNTP